MSDVNSEAGAVYFDADGLPVETRVKSARQALSMFRLWKDASKGRHQKARVVQGMFDGEPPYSQEKRDKAGKGWLANFNSLEAASRRDAAKVPYFSLFAQNETYFKVKTKVDEKEGLSADDAGRVMEEVFDEVLKEWDAYEMQFETMLDDFIAFNKGFPI